MQPRKFLGFLSGVAGIGAKWRALTVIFFFLIALSSGTNAQTKTAESDQPSLPVWLKSGTVRFARFDGGPIETQKTLRSAWAAGFAPQDRELMTNLYGTHADQMIDLLVQAKINFVWVTYSVGFSWREEQAQRVAAREVVKKLHARGIRAAAYVCAISIFWESMFKDDPKSVKWILIDDDGVPYRYSGGQDALRFVGNVDNHGWVEYQEQRVAAVIDDGFDAVFFDNPFLDEHPSEPKIVSRFFEQLVDYARHEKKSNIPFFTNLGLQPPFNLLNHQMDFIFTEGWTEPGAWGNQWEVSNIRRDRLARGLNPGLKPIVSEYSHFHHGDRNDSYLGPRSEKLAIAEAAAFGTSYTWDMEGPFDTALATQNPKALQYWSAISQYNGFLADHPELYADAANVTPWVVLLPDNLVPDFDWTISVTRLDFLARNSVLGDVELASRVTAKDLGAYRGVIVPALSSLPTPQKEMLRDFQRGGGKVSLFSETSSESGLDAEILPPSEGHSSKDKSAEDRVLAEIISLAPDATHIELEKTANHVLANLTSVNNETLVIHLLNYDQTPSSELKLKLLLGKEFQKLVGHKPTLLSPDAANSTLQNVQWKGATLQATIPSVDSYSVIVLH